MNGKCKECCLWLWALGRPWNIDVVRMYVHICSTRHVARIDYLACVLFSLVLAAVRSVCVCVRVFVCLSALAVHRPRSLHGLALR